jgi:hypothetical protein
MSGLILSRKSLRRWVLALSLGALAAGGQFSAAQAAPDAGIRLTAPLDWQVVQRRTFREGVIAVTGYCVLDCDRVEARVASGKTMAGRSYQSGWVRTKWNAVTKEFAARLPTPAGGWYVVEARAPKGGNVVAAQKVDHVGVGEVFVITGQSNAANFGEVRQKTQTGLVSVFDVDNHRWQLACDPEPGSGGDGGSFLPPFGDNMAKRFQVPVGVVSCAIGATSVRQWLPKGVTFSNPPTLTFNITKLPDGEWSSNGDAFNMLVRRMKQLGPHGFRAVLWHQGESDANQPDPKCTLSGPLYTKYLEQIIRESRKDIGWDAPWFVAQASYHSPADTGSPEIRAAQKAVWEDKAAFAGPDTDALRGDLRAANGQSVHLSDQGLRAHGALWAKKVGDWLAKFDLDSTPRSARISAIE